MPNGGDKKVKGYKRGKNVPKAPKQRKSKVKKAPVQTVVEVVKPMSSTANTRKTTTATRYSPKGDWRYDSYGKAHPTKKASKRTEPKPKIDTYGKKK